MNEQITEDGEEQVLIGRNLSKDYSQLRTYSDVSRENKNSWKNMEPKMYVFLFEQKLYVLRSQHPNILGDSHQISLFRFNNSFNPPIYIQSFHCPGKVTTERFHTFKGILLIFRAIQTVLKCRNAAKC